MQLNDELSKHFRINEIQAKALERLGVRKVRDLIYHFPTRYQDASEVKLIQDVTPGENATLYGTISKLKTKKGFRSKIPMGEAELTDPSGKIKVMWFNQAYMAKMVHEGASVLLTGKITDGKNGMYLANPELARGGTLPIDAHNTLFEGNTPDTNLYPVYRETRGITSKWIYHTITKIFGSGMLETIPDYIPDDILKKYNLPSLKSALIFIHSPRKKTDADAARKRFAFEEVFLIQLRRFQDRDIFSKKMAYNVEVDKKEIERFMDGFPFTPTDAQKNAIDTILSDIEKSHPMARLLEGDVGSGKTAVAATASYAVIKNRPNSKFKINPLAKEKDRVLSSGLEKQNFGNLQVAYMAPTEILATQLFENFIGFFKGTGIQIGLMTGSGCRKFPTKVASANVPWTNISRAQLLKWVVNGEIPILIGTHALIQKSVKFKDLALVIIDEQHRFGVSQRAGLAKKEGHAPHLLSMTATPIPRTLALTIYGDLDLSLLDQMPSGRKPIETEITTVDKRDAVYEKIRKELEAGRQLYVICPRINEPDPDKQLALQMKDVTSEAKRLKKDVFQKYEIGILHSKMTKDKKESVMRDFSEKKIDILVATSVVEVGVNVPNATIIIIEGAERFGLAQLHQLRGRVIRSNHQAYCYLFADAKSDKTIERMKALVTAKNGFELAELDLALRGSGELVGDKQWGLTDLGMEAIKNMKMVEAARNEAGNIITNDPDLKAFPSLKNELEKRHIDIHFE
jgi:ATP-dependent DNA helicase RecG